MTGEELLGDGALRIPLPPGLSPRAVLEALRALPGVVDAVVTPSFACVYFEPSSPPLSPAAALASLSPDAAAVQGRSWVVPVRYDGPDLLRVAEWAGLPPARVVELHAAREYEVQSVGFLPGFAYLGEVDPRIAAPRLPSPRPRVPVGAVGIAGANTALYPLASPGGWNLIATAVGFAAFTPERGATLALGDRVRFEAVAGEGP